MPRFEEQKNRIFFYPFINLDNCIPPEDEIVDQKNPFIDSDDEDTETKITLRAIDITEKIHSNWIDFFKKNIGIINELLKSLYSYAHTKNMTIYPRAEDCMNVFSMAPEKVKCVIIGEDPYPGFDKKRNLPVACGKSFASYSEERPASQINLLNSIAKNFGPLEKPFNENYPNSLEGWTNQGVFLLNSNIVLYKTKTEYSEIHKNLLDTYLEKRTQIWNKVSIRVCEFLSNLNKCPFILLGNKAKNLAQHVTKSFNEPHPSPKNEIVFEGKTFVQVTDNEINWKKI